jgi:hypothetical protein
MKSNITKIRTFHLRGNFTSVDIKKKREIWRLKEKDARGQIVDKPHFGTICERKNVSIWNPIIQQFSREWHKNPSMRGLKILCTSSRRFKPTVKVIYESSRAHWNSYSNATHHSFKSDWNKKRKEEHANLQIPKYRVSETVLRVDLNRDKL